MAEASGIRAPRELADGELFAGRYRVDARIGQGGMGTVYRAHDTYLGETIALKILDTGAAPTPTAIMRFREEVRLARRVTHPNIVRVFDIGESDGCFFLTMELFEGKTLRALLKERKSLGATEASGIIVAIADGLAAIHAAGIVHRDLKPENVLIQPSGRVAISDFGIARHTGGELSLTQGALGTPMYMAPEQAAAGEIDARADLYAFGTMAYEILVGALPYCSIKQINDSLISKGVSQAFSSFVIRCLERDPEARPKAIGELLCLLTPPAAQPTPTPDRSSAIPPISASKGFTTPPRDSFVPAAPATFAAAQTATQATPGPERFIAVLPLRYVGPPDHAYLADVLGEELVDTLSHIRGLMVLGLGATSKYKTDRDAQKVGRELKARAIVDGTIQVVGSKFRITARLLDSEQGTQRWSSQFEGGMGDLFEVQTSIAQRIAEELRVELYTLAHATSATPAEAIELYLTGRKHLRSLTHAGIRESASLFARAISLAPDFKPALAAHAHACLRCWFLSIASSGEPDWETLARASVERALQFAPDLAEAQLTASMLSTQNGDFRMAVHHAARAILIAPTFADALEYLGMLECEAGRSKKGCERISLALRLNPALLFGLYFTARTHVMHGRTAEAEAILGALEKSRPDHPQLLFAQIRLSAWKREPEKVRLWASKIPDIAMPVLMILRLYAKTLLGEVEEAQADKQFARILADTQNPRMSMLIIQFATEAFGYLHRPERAIIYLIRAAAGVFVDVEWLDFCPLLADLRAHPKFAEARRKVLQRSEALWAVDNI